MRLLYVCSDFGIEPSGTKGASVHLRAITAALAELGHEVQLLSPRKGPDASHPAERLLAPGCPEVRQSSNLLKEWLLDHDFGDTVAKEFRQLLYNAWVHDRAVAALQGSPPTAIIERLALHSHVGLDVAETLRVPYFVEVNALLTEEARRFRALELQGLAEAVERRVLQRADAILTVSSSLADKLVNLGVAPAKIHVVPNGVNLRDYEDLPARAACRAELDLHDEFVVGFCGSLKTWHGVDVLLTAFGEFLKHDGSARLLIVGNGPTEEALRKMADLTGIRDSVLFTGAVPHNRIPTMLRTMDVAVAPFRSMENFYFSPIKLFEYMASNTCVIASRLGQMQEVIEDDFNGLLCRPDDTQDLCKALVRAQQSAPLRRRLAAAALETVRQRYTWRHAAETTVEVINQNRSRMVAQKGRILTHLRAVPASLEVA